MTNTSLKLENGIPVAKDGRGRPLTEGAWLMRDMKRGQSFFVSCANSDKPTKRKALSTMAWRIATKIFPGRKFTVRQMPDGIRVWRIK